MTRLYPLWLVCGMLLWAGTEPAQAQGYRTLVPEPGTSVSGKRTALVIGNSAYAHARPLQNPGHDAADMAAALHRLGFTVVTGTDLSQEAMERAVDDFTEESQGAAVALVFYAGHGVEVQGENFLIPVDARIEAQTDVKYRAVSAAWVLERVKGAVGEGLSMLVLDACRDNPFRSWRSSGGGGLSAMNGPSGSIIAYATGPGDVASDNETGRNGLYTQMLLEEMARPGVEVSRMLRRVGARVAEASSGEQQPWMAASYVNDFYLAPEQQGGTPVASAEDLFRRGRAAEIAAEFDAALSAYQQAAEMGHAGAMAGLADVYYYGLGVLVNDAKAIRWAERAAGAGDPNGMHRLAAHYEHGIGMERDAAAADRWGRQSIAGLRRLANAGDAVAQKNLGDAYRYAIGTRPGDAAGAVQWYRRSAEQGYAPAQTTLGVMYSSGEGVEPDAAEAARWYRRAAEQGYARAQEKLGDMYQHGRGVERSDATAIYWYRKAAEQGHAGAQTTLGVKYAFGYDGLVKDDAEAARWYRKAAEQGHAGAQNNLGVMYQHGRGVEKNIETAVYWYRKAAEQGSQVAKDNLRELGYDE